MTEAKETKQFSIYRALFAEMFGCFLLTFADSFISIIDRTSTEVGILGKSLVPALVIGTFIFIAGEISGAHANPVITFAFSVRGIFPWKRLPLFWFFQIVGALLAGSLIYYFFHSDIRLGVTEPQDTDNFAFLIEILLSTFLVTSVVTSACASSVKGWQAALPVGATILFCGLLGKDISGASMNPARSLGTAVFVDASTIWIYIIGPLVGALIGVIIVYALRGKPTEKELEAAQGK